jgi:hypothetical protein
MVRLTSAAVDLGECSAGARLAAFEDAVLSGRFLVLFRNDIIGFSLTSSPFSLTAMHTENTGGFGAAELLL